MIDIILKYVNQPVSMTLVVCVIYVTQQTKFKDIFRRLSKLEGKCEERHNWCLTFFQKSKNGGK